METITSTQNKNVKLARSLAEKKFRDESGLFLVEGANILRDMPESLQVEFFLVDEEKAEDFKPIYEKFGCDVFAAQAHVLKSACDTVSPQGIAAVVKKNPQVFELPQKNALVLDGVSDAGNLGTILRTAAAAGFESVFLLDCADVYSPKTVRASMGGIFRVKCFEVDEKAAVEVLKNSNGCALDMSGGSIFETEKNGQVTYIGGSEAHGVRKILLENAKKTVSIPMRNNMESLNVAVALAIAMYNSI